MTAFPLAAELAVGAGAPAGCDRHGLLCGLSRLSGLTEINECPYFERWLGGARGDEPRA
jgi:hypothetical protein